MLIFFSIMMKKWLLLKYIPISKLECKNHTLFITKMAEISLNWYPIYDQNSWKNHTPWGRTYLYSPYKGVPLSRDWCPSGWDQHGVSIQISINLGKMFVRISSIGKLAVTWILARGFAYLPSFYFQILDLIYYVFDFLKSILNGVTLKTSNSLMIKTLCFINARVSNMYIDDRTNEHVQFACKPEWYFVIKEKHTHFVLNRTLLLI